MYIKRLKITNFRSFYGEHEINFEQLKGTYKVTGQIGSGKSTISMAILYGLFGSVNGQNQTDLISWGLKESQIELDIESKGHAINIQRTLYPYGQCPLKITIDNAPLEASNKRGLQQSLEDYLDVSRLSMELLCIISFNNFKSLSSMNLKDINDFQDQILGFSVLNDYKEASKEQAKAFKENAIKISTEIATNEKLSNELKNKPKKIEGDIDALQKEVEELKKEYKESSKVLQDSIEVLKKDHKAKNDSTNQIVFEGKKISKDIDFIKKGTCPTCGAPISQDKLPELEALKKTLGEAYKASKAEVDSLQSQINTLQTQLTALSNEHINKTHKLEQTIAQLKIQESYMNDDTETIERLANELLQLSSDLDATETTQSKYDDLSKFLGEPMRSKLTSAYIRPINERCRQICLQAGLSFVPQFNEQFRCSIEKDGINVPVSALSTGQSKMIDLICILSIISSIINSSRCNIIFLDELFSNLDSNARETMLRILPTIFPSDSTIMIVSHQGLNNDLLSGAIELSLDSGHSSISITRFD